MTDAMIEQLFRQAIQLSGPDREAFLNKLNDATRHEIELLLTADESAERHGHFEPIVDITMASGGRQPSDDKVGHSDPHLAATNLNNPADPGTTNVQPQESTDLPKHIANYKILQQIGEGGMGSVYMAEQTEPVKRRVALKVIKAGMGSKEVIARFEAERQALAMMDHPNIAKVLDAGTTDDGRPYFVMELVRGIPITRYCDENRLTPNERLAIFIKVCRAIQHAHQKGVIHRDIKPTNVLVGQADGEPFPKVIDFGLAKALQSQSLTDKTMFTQFGQVVGTLEYMSPEQAEMNIHDVDTRTDVYSLGVLLYELLTGSTPITRERLKGAALDRIIQLIREEDAPRPSLRLSDSGDEITGISEQRRMDPKRLGAILKGDLDWIAVKALEKDRKRRYDGAGSLADDLKRYLGDEAIEARPPSFGYRLHKTYRKYRYAFIATISVVTLLVVGLISTGAMWRLAAKRATQAQRAERKSERATIRAQRARDEAVQHSQRLKRQTRRFGLQAAYSQLAVGETDMARLTLQSIPQPDRSWAWKYLWSEANPFLGRIPLQKTRNVAAISRTGRVALVHNQSDSTTLDLIDAYDGEVISRVDLPAAKRLISGAISGNGHRVALVAANETDPRKGLVSTLYVWDSTANQVVCSFRSELNASGKLLGFTSDDYPDAVFGFRDEPTCSISIDGKRVSTCGLVRSTSTAQDIDGFGNSNGCIVFDIPTGKSVVVPAPAGGLLSADGAFLIDGSQVHSGIHELNFDDVTPTTKVSANFEKSCYVIPVEDSQVLALSTKHESSKWRFFDLGRMEECEGPSFAHSGLWQIYDSQQSVLTVDGRELVAKTPAGEFALGLVPRLARRLFVDTATKSAFVYSDTDILRYPLPDRETVARLAECNCDKWPSSLKSLVLNGNLLVNAESAGGSHDFFRDARTGQLQGLIEDEVNLCSVGETSVFGLRGKEIWEQSGLNGERTHYPDLKEHLPDQRLLLVNKERTLALQVSREFPDHASSPIARCLISELSTGNTVAKWNLGEDYPIHLGSSSVWVLTRVGVQEQLLPTMAKTLRLPGKIAAVSMGHRRIAAVNGKRVIIADFPDCAQQREFALSHDANIDVAWGLSGLLAVTSETFTSICDPEAADVILTIPVADNANSTGLYLGNESGYLGGRFRSSHSRLGTWQAIERVAQLETQAHAKATKSSALLRLCESRDGIDAASVIDSEVLSLSEKRAIVESMARISAEIERVDALDVAKLRRSINSWLSENKLENLRPLAVALIRNWTPTTEKLNSVAWPVAAAQNKTANEYSLAVIHADGAVKQEPKSWYLWNTLGVARFRCEDYKQAIEALDKSVALNDSGPDPSDLAFLAMSHHQLGNTQEANKYRNQLTEVMKLDEFKDDEEALGFVEEVNALFKQKAAGEAKPAIKSEGNDNE